ncbi:hypothetical protein HPB47_015423, partial [Ixodes persulcatus]
MAQQQANAASYSFDLLTSDWPSASPHGDNTDAVYEPQHSTAATGAPIHSAGPHRGNNPPAAHAESDSHHRENTLGAYHPLLENAARVIESLTGALQTAVRPPPPTRPPVRIPIPTYRGYGDRVSATDFLENLKKYQQAMGMSDHEILERILPISLVDQAARWLRLTGSQLSSIEQFRKAFRQEFLPADYERRMRRELEQRTQHPDESLLEIGFPTGTLAPFIALTIVGRTFKALLDTGASASLFGDEVLTHLQQNSVHMREGNTAFRLACGTAHSSGTVRLVARWENRVRRQRFVHLPSLSVPIILGRDFLAKTGIVID